MHIFEYAADDAGVVAEVLALGHAVCAADCPWVPPDTHESLTRRLRHGWDGESPRAFAAREDGQLVAAGEIWASDYDNLDAAWLGVGVHPAWRRQGLGSRLLERLLGEVRATGRTSVGIDGWDLPRVRAFASRHGFAQKSVDVQRRQVLAELDRAALDRLVAEAATRAADYELERLPGPSPASLLPELAEVVGAINDAPRDDLDLEDERFPVERVRAYEDVHMSGGRLYRVLARHRSTGQLAGHTVVHVDGSRPWFGEQHDTAVAVAHRGHRLGLLLKAEMVRWLGEVEPQLEHVDTWNARSNAHMIEVNEALGYRVVGTTLSFQRTLTAEPAESAARTAASTQEERDGRLVGA